MLLSRVSTGDFFKLVDTIKTIIIRIAAKKNPFFMAVGDGMGICGFFFEMSLSVSPLAVLDDLLDAASLIIRSP